MDALARLLWQLIEPYHAVTYFAPESQAAYESAGLRGFWRGYFAGRAAPLGPVGAGAVTATFYGFHPSFVGRAVPSVWTMAPPEKALRARLSGIDDALRRIFTAHVGSTMFADAADLARRSVDGCDEAGRPLFAANLELAWPDEPHLKLWHAATLLREHRGDGHVAALLVNGIDPCEAHITQVAASGAGVESIKPYRGWSDDDWSAAVDALRARNVLDRSGALTDAGRALRTKLEEDTDRLASPPVRELGEEQASRLCKLLEPIAVHLVDTDEIPYPNPIGVPAPEGAGPTSR